jgi:hypothetical protein
MGGDHVDRIHSVVGTYGEAVASIVARADDTS